MNLGSWTIFCAVMSLGAPGERQRLSDGVVRFEQGSSVLTEASQRTLDRIGAYIKKQGDGDILIVGHTDRHGGSRLNRDLSKRRALEVKRALVRRGVPASRMSVLGLGDQEPISNEATEAADLLNRRVELWVGTREAIAWVSWIRRTVQAQKPAALQWDPALLKMPLRALFKVRTVGPSSAGEVTFKAGNRLYLGPEGLLVVYGREAQARRQKRAVRDISLEEGSLFAKLAARERAPLKVATPAANMRVDSKKTRIEHSRAKARSTVSVYEGRAGVRAQGKRVQVDEGYGTRVKVGEPPETPRRLLKPPKWTSRGPLRGVGGTLELAFLAPDAERVVIELFSPSDTAMERPLRIIKARGPRVALKALEPGAYRLRVTAVDERGVVGLPSDPIDAVVRPALKGPGGLIVAAKDGLLKLPRPGVFELPQGGRWQRDGAPVKGAVVLGPGQHALTWQAHGQQEHLMVEVAPLRLMLESVSEPWFEAGQWRRKVVVQVHDGRGQGVPELSLVTRRIATTDTFQGLLGTLSPEGPMVDCRCSPGAFLRAALELGEGRYSFDDAQPSTLFAASKISVIDKQSRTARTLELPPVIALEAPTARRSQQPETLESSWHIGAMAGAQLAAQPSISPAFALQAGLTLTGKHSFLRMNLGADVGFTTGPLDTGGVSGRLMVLPVMARLDVAFALSILRPYLGAAGGLSWVRFQPDEGSPSINPSAVQPAYNVLAGLGLTALGGELFIEGRLGPLGLRGTALEASLGGPTVMVGYRWSPGF